MLPSLDLHSFLNMTLASFPLHKQQELHQEERCHDKYDSQEDQSVACCRRMLETRPQPSYRMNNHPHQFRTTNVSADAFSKFECVGLSVEGMGVVVLVVASIGSGGGRPQV